MANYAILYDSLQELSWFRQLDPRLASVPARELTARDRSSKRLELALSYDRPDIVLVADGDPILVIERSEEVPSGHNVGQRFARIAAAAKAGAVTVKFFPFVAKKHGGKTAGPRFLNLRLIEAMRCLERTYGVPVVPLSWPVDRDYEIINGPTKDEEIRRLLAGLLDMYESGGSPRDFAKSSFVREAHDAADRFATTMIKRRDDYDSPPPSVRIVPTTEAMEEFGIAGTEMPEHRESLVYRVGMTGIRSDPYTGSAVLYDYLYCRATGENRNRAMILHFPEVTMADWRSAASRGASGKTVKLFVEVADLIVFADGYLTKARLLR